MTVRGRAAALALVSVAALAACSGGKGSGPTTTARDPMQLIEEAQRLRDEGDVAGAQQALEQAVAADPASAVALYDLAIIERDQNQFLDAAKKFRQLVGMRPQVVEMRIELVKALRNGGSDEEALAAGREALAQFPDDPTLMYIVGKLLVARGEFDEGDRLMMAAMRMMPELETSDP